MPRFFFDVHDGRDLVDDLGQQLPDLAAARRYTLGYAARLIADLDETFWSDHDWRIDVRDEAGLVHLSLILIGIDAPVVDSGPR